MLTRDQVFFFQKRVLGGVILFRRAFGKSKNGFVKQNRKLVYTCGFRFWVYSSEQADFLPQNSDNLGFGAHIPRKKIFQFDLFRRVRRKSKPAFVHHLSILLHKCGFRFFKCASGDPPKLRLRAISFSKETYLFPGECPALYMSILRTFSQLGPQQGNKSPLSLW